MGQDGMSFEDFLNHDSRGAEGTFLKNWKDAGSVVVWLHTRSKIHPRHVHQFPYVDKVEDRETQAVKRVLRSLRFGCWESEQVLAKRYKRDDVTGERELPPDVCPGCLLLEALVVDKKLPGDAVVFSAEARDRDGNPVKVALVKGYLTGAFKKTSQSWKQDIGVRDTWLCTVVQDGHPEYGPKVSEIPTSLAESIRREIKKQMDSLGVDDGNPLKNPYALKWRYNKEAKSPRDYYEAYRFAQAKLTEEVRLQIVVTDPPDISQYARRGNPFTLRSVVEETLTPEARRVLDLDAIFAKSEAVARESEEGGDAEPRRPREEPRERQAEAPTPADQGGGRRRKKAEPPPEPMGDPCDECGAPMRRGQLRCEKCGAEYEDDPAPSPQQSPAGQRVDNTDAVDDDLPF